MTHPKAKGYKPRTVQLWYYWVMKETFILKQEDLKDLAQKVIEILEKIYTSKSSLYAMVILLEGDLGAGKTTFTKYLADYLGVDSSTVHSPTFILKKSYKINHETFTKLIHIDAYRFEHPDEDKVLQMEDDLKDPENIIVIEWPSKMNHVKSDIEIIIKVIDDDTREITLLYGKK